MKKTLLGCILLAGCATAQTMPAPTPATPAAAPAAAAGTCPALRWAFVRQPAGDVTNVKGVLWFSDMSGISAGTGTIDRAGRFQLTVTPLQPNGPQGTATGVVVGDGSVNASMVGPGCSTTTVRIMPQEFPMGSGR